jgi:hypothetical protein
MQTPLVFVNVWTRRPFLDSLVGEYHRSHEGLACNVITIHIALVSF